MSRPHRHSSLYLRREPTALSGVKLRFTPLMQKRLTRRAHGMIERALAYFPELHGHSITVGYTRVHLGSAVLSPNRDRPSQLVIRLQVRNLTYQTIGHELTHLVQGLPLCDEPSGPYEHIPSGETQCDIWTLARHELFCDDAPTYIKMPRTLRELWPGYAKAVRKLCVTAINKRTFFKPYIRWLESEIARLPRRPLPEKIGPAQLVFPFGD